MLIVGLKGRKWRVRPRTRWKEAVEKELANSKSGIWKNGKK